MKISAKIDYACRALIELSLHWPNKSPLQINAIARRQNIPIKFLTHILINLKQLGYVDSVRGKSGGYLIVRQPKDVRLSDVVVNLGGLGMSESDPAADPAVKFHVMDKIWSELDQTILEKLSRINFEMISDNVRSQTKALMFEI